MDQSLEIQYALKNSRIRKPRPDKGLIIAWPLATEKRMQLDFQRLFYKFLPKLVRTPAKKTDVSKRILEWDTSVDTYDPDIKKFLEELTAILALLFISFVESSLTPFLSTVYDSVMNRLVKSMSDQIADRTGVPFISNGLFTYEDKRAWMESVFEESKKIFNDSLQKMRTIIDTGILSGWSAEDFHDSLKAVQDQAVKKRLPMLAHFAIGMATVSVMKKFMTNIGMTQYIWSTMKDERVRGNPLGKYPHAVPSHWIIDNKICKWEDASVYSDDGVIFKKRTAIMPKTHPGMEMNCRCVPVMYWGTIMKNVEELR